MGEPDPRRRIAALKEMPSWRDMEDEWKQKREIRIVAIGRKFMTGVPLEQRALDYERGFWKGVMAVLDTPDRAELAIRKLEEGVEE